MQFGLASTCPDRAITLSNHKTSNYLKSVDTVDSETTLETIIQNKDRRKGESQIQKKKNKSNES